MAVFQHGDQAIPYRIDLAPFAHDLVLLQGSRFDSGYWKPVLLSWAQEANQGGRVLTLEWGPLGPGRAEVLARLLQTLGLHEIYVVAMDDAVILAGELQRLQPGLFAKSLLYPKDGPKGGELERAVRAFCGL